MMGQMFDGMPGADAQVGPIVGLLLVLFSVAGLTLFSRKRQTRVVDQILALGLLAWTVFLVWQPRFGSRPPDMDDEFIEHMAFQLCVAAACRLILTGTNLFKPLTLPLWTGQLLGGGVLLLAWVWTGNHTWMEVWETFNAMTLTAVALVLVWRWREYRHQKAYWIALWSGVLVGFGLAPGFWHHPSSGLGIGGLFVFPAALIALWSLVTVRQRLPLPATVDAASLMEMQRQRIAQEVHDGVGSQLVSILASLDARDPRQQFLALALERCLLELKITVDSLQPEPPSLLDGLAMLRYRLQPSLDRLGMHLQWSVEDHPAMSSLPQLTVTHALRMVQEAVANALRHSRATRLELVCRYDAQDGAVRLSVADNGVGMAEPGGATARGHGLPGMRRRAQEAHIGFALVSAPQQGCTVTLSLLVADTVPTLGSALTGASSVLPVQPVR